MGERRSLSILWKNLFIEPSVTHEYGPKEEIRFYYHCGDLPDYLNPLVALRSLSFKGNVQAEIKNVLNVECFKANIE